MKDDMQTLLKLKTFKCGKVLTIICEPLNCDPGEDWVEQIKSIKHGTTIPIDKNNIELFMSAGYSFELQILHNTTIDGKLPEPPKELPGYYRDLSRMFPEHWDKKDKSNE